MFEELNVAIMLTACRNASIEEIKTVWAICVNQNTRNANKLTYLMHAYFGNKILHAFCPEDYPLMSEYTLPPAQIPYTWTEEFGGVWIPDTCY